MKISELYPQPEKLSLADQFPGFNATETVTSRKTTRSTGQMLLDMTSVTVQNIAALLALNPAESPDKVAVSQFGATANDGSGGIFYRTTDVSGADNVTKWISTANASYAWVRIFDGPIDEKWASSPAEAAIAAASLGVTTKHGDQVFEGDLTVTGTLAADTLSGSVAADILEVSGESSFEDNAVFKGPSPWVDVKAFGATGDGITDDSVSIIAAAAAATGTLFFPLGTYLFSQQLTYRSNQKWEFAGGAKLKMKDNSVTNGLTLLKPNSAGVSGTVFVGLHIDGNAANNQGVDGGDCVSVTDAKDISFFNTLIENSSRDGINIAQTVANATERIKFFDLVSRGAAGSSLNGAGIAVTGGHDIVVDGFSIYSNKLFGIAIEPNIGTGTGYITGVKLCNGECNSTVGGSGIALVNNTGGISDVVIDNVRCASNVGPGLSFSDNGTGNVIRSLRVSNVFSYQNKTEGFKINKVEDSVFLSCQAIENGQSLVDRVGFSLTSVANTVISDCVAVDLQVSVTQNQSFVEASSCSKNKIINCYEKGGGSGSRFSIGGVNSISVGNTSGNENTKGRLPWDFSQINSSGSSFCRYSPGAIEMGAASSGVEGTVNVTAQRLSNGLRFYMNNQSGQLIEFCKDFGTTPLLRLSFDSLTATIQGIMSLTGATVQTPSTLQSIAASGAILANATKVRVVGTPGAVTANATTAIADGTEGQFLLIQGTNDTNTVAIADASNVELAGGATVTLGAGDILALTFDSTAGVWYELYRSAN